MTSDQAGQQAGGAWLATAWVLLVVALAFHGPLNPDLQVQMVRIAEAAVVGGSYGGYMVNAVLANFPGHFVAGASLYGVADLTSDRCSGTTWLERSPTVQPHDQRSTELASIPASRRGE